MRSPSLDLIKNEDRLDPPHQDHSRVTFSVKREGVSLPVLTAPLTSEPIS